MLLSRHYTSTCCTTAPGTHAAAAFRLPSCAADARRLQPAPRAAGRPPLGHRECVRAGPESADGDAVEARDEAARHVDPAHPRHRQHRRHRACLTAQLAALQIPRPAIKVHAHSAALAGSILCLIKACKPLANVRSSEKKAPDLIDTSYFENFLSSFPKRATVRSSKFLLLRECEEMN